jgi:uncharacterized membrane protein required for colicin V production
MSESSGQFLIDLLFLILCLRIIYIAISYGFICEFFKTAGLLLGSFFAFQYYPLVNIIAEALPFLNRGYSALFSFLLILLGVNLFFVLSRMIVMSLFKIKEIYFKQKVVLFLLGGFRAVFTSSIILFLLYLSPLDSKYFCHNISYGLFKGFAPKIYLASFKVYNKVSTKAIVNKEVEAYYETRKFLPAGSK